MAAKLKHQESESTGGSNVLTLSKCMCEGCGKKGELSTGDGGFCKEHYSWFKFGLLTREGKKPIDFDKKWMAYKKHAA